MSTNDLEQLLEERARLENEVRVAQLDLDNCIALNEENIQDNITKEARLEELEGIKIALDADLPVEMRFLEVERECLFDRYEYDMAVITQQNSTLDARVKWINDIEKETADMKAKTCLLRDEYAAHCDAHSQEMHELNVALFKKSRKIEETFVTAVHRAYRTHKEKALAELSEEHVRVLDKQRALLSELDTQRKGIACLQANVEVHEKECQRIAQFCEASTMEAAELRSKLVELSSASRAASVEARVGGEGGEGVENHAHRHRRQSEALSDSLQPTISAELARWQRRLAGLEALREDLRAVRSVIAVRSPKAAVAPSSGGVGRRTRDTLLRLADEDEDFREATEQLLASVEAGAAEDDSVDSQSNVVVWLAFQVP